ncbi:Uncharacterised protein [Serratia proteamaculans]|nr:Uncharacterised protein [Serratia proteamaculans]CAI2405416.1 Uncharacterised protein [Serratia proteamaculans]
MIYDNVASPYVVQCAQKESRTLNEIAPPPRRCQTYPSRSFSDLRDKLGYRGKLTIEEHPTFHEVHVLTAHLLDNQGIDPQSQMTHSDVGSGRFKPYHTEINTIKTNPLRLVFLSLKLGIHP